jgi:restriction endonuclease
MRQNKKKNIKMRKSKKKKKLSAFWLMMGKRRYLNIYLNGENNIKQIVHQAVNKNAFW